MVPYSISQQVDRISCLSYVFVQNIKQIQRNLTSKAVKRILKYLKGTTNVGLWYPSHSPIHLIGYSDSDFAGFKLDRKSTSGTCHLLGSSLISWHSKKQACVALSTAEAEYIAAGSCCAQILWLKQQLADLGLQISKVPLMCYNTSAINLTKNQIQHSRTKHIETRLLEWMALN